MSLTRVEIGIMIGIICLSAIAIVICVGYCKLKYSAHHGGDVAFFLNDSADINRHKSPAIVQAESRARNYRYRAKHSMVRSASVVGGTESVPGNYTLTDQSPHVSEDDHSLRGKDKYLSKNDEADTLEHYNGDEGEELDEKYDDRFHFKC